MDIIRVLRIIEYVGPRDLVEEQIKQSVHGTKIVRDRIAITATTLGTFPEILKSDTPIKDQSDAH